MASFDQRKWRWTAEWSGWVVMVHGGGGSGGGWGRGYGVQYLEWQLNIAAEYGNVVAVCKAHLLGEVFLKMCHLRKCSSRLLKCDTMGEDNKWERWKGLGGARPRKMSA